VNGRDIETSPAYRIAGMGLGRKFQTAVSSKASRSVNVCG
jgi:ABC-type uncharacterized transport system ATPase subunit